MKIERNLTKTMEAMFKNDLTFTKGSAHCHSHNSIDDGFQNEMSICKRNFELGAKAAFISDHGTAQGWDDFDEAAQQVGIKPIFGVEAYYVDDLLDTRNHLILYAINNEGLIDIQKAMSRGTIDKYGNCCLTNDCLEYLRGGNIIATSACVGGPLGAVVLYNDKLKEKAQKIDIEIEGLRGDLEHFNAIEPMYKELVEEHNKAKKRLSEAKKLAKQSFKGKEKRLAATKKKVDKVTSLFDSYLLDGKDKSLKVALSQLEIVVDDDNYLQEYVEKAQRLYEKQAAQLKAEMKEAKEISKEIANIEKEVNDLASEKSEMKKQYDSLAKVVNKVEVYKERQKAFEEQRISSQEATKIVMTRLNKMLDVFGDNFYIEVQNHGLDNESRIYPWLANIARTKHIPIIAGNDAHITTNSEQELLARQIRCACRFKKWSNAMPSDSEMYIKDDRELALALYQILPEDIVIEAMTNVAKVVDTCNAMIEKGSHAPKVKGVKNVKEEMVRLARQNIQKKYGDEWGEVHEERFNHEVSIIDSMGFNDYFVITYDIVNIGRKIGGLSYENLDKLKEIMNDMSLNELLAYLDKYSTEINLSVGLGRGSGAGSIVCYLLGITNIDPLKYDLLFERFLNPERISMPDIDTDFRTDIKDVILVYLKKKYGDRAIAQILTKSFLKGKSAIDKVCMIFKSRDEKDYRYVAEKLKKSVDLDKHSLLECKEDLLKVCDNDVEREIVEAAVIMNDNLDHTGLHAAGVIISDNEDLSQYIPVAWDEGFKTWKTQCNMVQCESKHGLLKMDLLLLTTLDIITYTLRLIKKNHPNVDIDIENLPMEKEVFENIYANGNTKSIFQFESPGMINFLTQLKPTCVEDIIAANAMYRPGPMDSIPDYIKAKHSGNITYDCPQLEPILKDTYGQIVYQEQVTRIVRDLAGYSLGRSDLVRRAMAKKHMDELVAERENFIYGNEKEGIVGCLANNVSESVASAIFDKMIAFASYAFNKSHSAAYSVTSYMTAWLKYHYPAEFYCSALNFVKAQKEIPSIIADAKKEGIKILKPHINKSQTSFVVEDGAIRFGLKFLSNANTRAKSLVEARGEVGFRSFKEFVKSQPEKQLAEACIFSGACDMFIKNNPNKREALYLAYLDLSALHSSILSQKNVDELIKKWDEYKLPNIKDMSLLERLTKEQQYTSIFFTGDPLDHYQINPNEYTPISNLELGKSYWIACSMVDSKELKTKKDGKAMLSGRLADKSGGVDFIIFPNAYKEIEPKLECVMGFYGNFVENNDDVQFVVTQVKTLPQKNKIMTIWTEDYNATKKIVLQGKVSSSEGVMAYIGAPNSKIYPIGYITEQYAIDNNLDYEIAN